MIKEFNINEHNDKKIIVYGAGTIGEYVYYILNSHGVSIEAFCDRLKLNQYYFNIPVISPEEIIDYKDECILIAASGNQFTEIYENLQKKEILDVYNVYSLLENVNFDREILSENAKDYERIIENFFWKEKARIDLESIYLENLDLVITQRCSLKCKNCCNLMQYYDNPKDCIFEEVITQFDKMLKYVDEIYNLFIIGGEPFMNKDIYDYIEYYIENPKIKYITVFTNATIMPEIDRLKYINRNKLQFAISDYGSKSTKFNEIYEILDRWKIHKTIYRYDSWYDLGLLKEHDYTKEKIGQVYKDCFCRALTFFDGKLYCCPYSAHGRTLEAIPEAENDAVSFDDLCKDDMEKKRFDLKYFIHNKTMDLACKYCNGKNLSIPVVAVADQVKEPMKYKKYWE